MVERYTDRFTRNLNKRISEMDKKAKLKEIYQESFNDELRKIAEISVGDIEDRIGYYLPDELEGKTREFIADETDKRFAVRHPWLTGIPTLGIWPSVSKENAVSQIISNLARREPRARELISQGVANRRAAAIENARLQIESDKANQFSNAVAASVLPIMAYKSQSNRFE